ncbi:MAG: AMP-binding protein [Kutzneria sp.]|nr:AMP-binding protein [Kutzneria sp.]MBV9847906.1 AMP-binding protein [Kutzneria sp.]
MATGLLTLSRARSLRAVPPNRLFGLVDGYLRWGLTLPFGYAFGAAARRHQVAIVDELGSLTYAEVHWRTTRLAHGLAGQGIRAGHTVGLLCRNHRGFVESLVACGKLGAHALLLNTGLGAEQLLSVLGEHGVAAVIADDEFNDRLRDLSDDVVVVTAWTETGPGKSRERALTVAGLIDTAPVVPLPRRPPGTVITLTSGTTGTAKGARRPELASLAPVAALLRRVPLRGGEPWLVSGPLFHTWGLAMSQIGVALGATLVLHRSFDPAAALAAVDRYRCTCLFAVPVMLHRILELPAAQRARHDLSCLRVVASSGSALPARLSIAFQREFGPVLYNLYGSTEVSLVSVATPGDLRTAPDTVGRPPAGTRLAILDESGAELPPGRTGQIFAVNALRFGGYTDGTGVAVRDGLTATGDVGRVDDAGRLFVIGRMDDMIISGGENVYPGQTEEVLAALPQVREVAVVGVPDREWGQRLAAFIVLADGAKLSADGVREHVRARLAVFSVPREVTFLDELPRNATGKIVKRRLGRPGEGTSPAAEPGATPRDGSPG